MPYFQGFSYLCPRSVLHLYYFAKLPFSEIIAPFFVYNFRTIFFCIVFFSVFPFYTNSVIHQMYYILCNTYYIIHFLPSWVICYISPVLMLSHIIHSTIYILCVMYNVLHTTRIVLQCTYIHTLSYILCITSKSR